MQIFLKLESWLCGWLSLWQLFQILHLVKPSVHLHDMLQFKQKHLPSVASYASKKTAAWKVYSSLPHPISLPHYSQITSKYIKLFIFPLRLLHSSLKKKKLVLWYNVWFLTLITLFSVISFHIYLHDLLHSTSSRGTQGQCLWLIKDVLWNDWQLQVGRQLQTQ